MYDICGFLKIEVGECNCYANITVWCNMRTRNALSENTNSKTLYIETTRRSKSKRKNWENSLFKSC